MANAKNKLAVFITHCEPSELNTELKRLGANTDWREQVMEEKDKGE